jgi:hypothetical protein
MSNSATTSLTNGVVFFQNVLINGSTTSPAFDTHGGTFSGLMVPTGAASTIIQILVSTSLDGTYVPLYDYDGAYMAAPGDVYELIVTAGTAGRIPADLVKAWRYFKLSCDSEETNKTFVVAYRKID